MTVQAATMFDDVYIDFSRACRVDKDETMDALDHDMDLIVECYNESCEIGTIVLVPYYKCQLPRKKYAQNILYQDIVSTLQRKGVSHLLLEMMPYIDSYIEYICI